MIGVMRGAKILGVRHTNVLDVAIRIYEAAFFEQGVDGLDGKATSQ